MITVTLNIMDFLRANSIELGEKLLQQLNIVIIAMVLAMAVGIPTAILAARKPHFKKIILSSAGLLQIIPSLALLAFLIPFFGIGVKPAIIALMLYALLPIISNTVIGLTSIPPACIQAANGLGFTNKQRLWIIELPLALPAIVAGIRMATTITVGTATLAAFVGAGGLGDFINRGLALNNTYYLLLGAIPAAILALGLDFLIRQIEIALTKGKTQFRKKPVFALSALFLILLSPMVTPFVTASSTAQNSQTIRIATTDFTEQLILGEILKQLIEAKTNLKIDLYSNLGTSQICFQALQHNQIDLYPEYTDVALLSQLHQPYIGVPREVIFQRAKTAYLQKFNLAWLTPFGFNDTQALGISQSFAEQHHVSSISALIPIEQQLTIAAPAEFVQREDGMPGLQQKYNLQFAAIKEMQPALMYEAIKNNQVNVIVAFGTDGRIPSYHLKLLQDDKHLFPAYDCAPLVRLAVLKEHPELTNVLQLLAHAIDDHTMQQLNYAVDLQQQSPAAVAHQFLLDKKLIG